MEDAERFSKLFAGYTARYGRYDMSSGAKPDKKIPGKARTIDREITDNDYAVHLKGKIGIGVIPLRDDNRVNFAAIDIDIYNPTDQEQRNLTHETVSLALFETPLVVTRSKSNGIHVWLFSRESVSARLASDYLKAQAAALGIAGAEIFPKQTERFSHEDVGNWINLPYFGDTRGAVIPNKRRDKNDFIDATLKQFLSIAERASVVVTDEWLAEYTNPHEKNQRVEQTDSPMFMDGPPCLQALCSGFPDKKTKIKQKFARGDITEDQFKKQMAFTEPQLREGARDNAFFNVALYLRRRISENDPDSAVDKNDLLAELREAHTLWGSRLYGLNRWDANKFGIPRDLPRLAAQASRGRWGFACTKEPLKGFCNKRLCLKRKFGIGTTQNDETGITGFTIVEAEDRQYYMNVWDKRVHIPDAAALNSQSIFAQHILNQTDRMWRMMQETKYKEMMDALLEKADRIKPPPDSDRRAMLMNALHDFINSKKIAKGKNDVSIHSGRVIWTDDEMEALFKFDRFLSFLRSRGFSWTPSMTAKMLTQDLNVEVRSNTHIGNKQIRPYVVHVGKFNEMIAEYDAK